MSENINDVSYAIGMSVGGSLIEQGLGELNIQEIAQALTDTFQGNKYRIDLEQANGIIQLYVQTQNEKQFEAVKQDGETFLKNNGSRDEISITSSGLQYEVLTEGNGVKPTPDNTVSVHYHGTLVDGTVFDSSVDRGTPASFGLTQVIKGWTEGLQLMPVGSKYRFYIPQDLAYGANPHPGGPIKPFATLVFDVELLEILN